jgi:hypothetical protein
VSLPKMKANKKQLKKCNGPVDGEKNAKINIITAYLAYISTVN